METEILEQKENLLLQRTEVRFQAKHPNEGTVRRSVLRDALAKLLNADKDRIVIDSSQSAFGTPLTLGYAKVYKTKEAALKFERPHVLLRNGLITPKVAAPAAGEEKPAPAPKKEEPKPAEKPKKEEKPAPKPAEAAKKESKAEGKPTEKPKKEEKAAGKTAEAPKKEAKK